MVNPALRRSEKLCALALLLTMTVIWSAGCSGRAGKAEQGMAGAGITVVARSPKGEVNMPPRHFFWTCAERDKTYFVKIVDSQNRTIYTQSTRDDHIAVPERIKETLQKLGAFTWQVEVRTLTGETLGKSEPVAVTVQATTQDSE